MLRGLRWPVALTWLVCCVLGTVVFVRPADAQAAPPIAPPPPIVTAPPVEVPVNIPTGVIVGTGVTAAGAEAAGVGGATAGGAVGTAALSCGTGTGGACIIAGAFFVGAFVGTYKLLEAVFPRPALSPPATFAQEYFQSDWKPCSSVPYTAWVNAAKALPGGYCSQYTFAPISGTDRTWRYVWPIWGGSLELTPVLKLSPFQADGDSAFEVINDGHYFWQTSNSGNTLGPSSIVIARPASEIAACQGFAWCGIRPGDKLAFGHAQNTTPGYRTQLGILPFDQLVAQYGYQRRHISNMTCINIDSGEEQTVQEVSGWFWDSDPYKAHPVVIPQCPAGRWTGKRLITELETLDGKGTKETLFDAHMPDTLLQALPDSCLLGEGCEPKRLTVSGVPQCQINGEQVDMSFCNNVDTVTQTQTSTGVTYKPTTATSAPPSGPSAPAPKPGSGSGGTVPGCPFCTPKPTDPEDGDDGCFPRGWGLLNPVDWVLKPTKCALRWAFIPDEGIGERMDRLGQDAQDSGVGAAQETMGLIGSGFGDAIGSLGNAPCQGPAWDVTIGGRTSHTSPMNSCSPKLAWWADFVRNVCSAVIVLAGCWSLWGLLSGLFSEKPESYEQLSLDL